jgi:hypothetical protein
VTDIYDPKFVKDVFDRCSDKYITFSLICSLGFTERWRRQCVAATSVNRLAFSQGHELAPHGATAVAITPAFCARK